MNLKKHLFFLIILLSKNVYSSTYLENISTGLLLSYVNDDNLRQVLQVSSIVFGKKIKTNQNSDTSIYLHYALSSTKGNTLDQYNYDYDYIDNMYGLVVRQSNQKNLPIYFFGELMYTNIDYKVSEISKKSVGGGVGFGLNIEKEYYVETIVNRLSSEHFSLAISAGLKF